MEENQLVVDEQFINQLRAQNICEEFSTKEPGGHLGILNTALSPLSSIPQENLIATTDFEESLNDLLKRTQSLDLVKEQQNDIVNREVFSCKS